MSKVEISKRLVLINTASGVLARILNVSVVLWLHQYLLHRISPQEYSLLPLLLSLILLLPLVTSILTAGLGRFVLAAYAQGDDRGITQTVSTVFPLLAGAGALILAGGWILAWHVDAVLRIPLPQLWDARIMMALLVLAAAVRLPCTAFSVGFYVQQKFVLYNVLSVGMEVLRVLLLFVLLFGIGTRVLWVVVANVTAEMALTAVALTLSRRMIPALRFRRRAIQWARARELLSFGGWTFVGEITYKLREMVIFFVLNHMTTPLDVTVFSLGTLGRRQLDTWMNVLAGPLYPVVTGMHALRARERVRAIYLRGGRLSLWIELLVVLPAVLYAEPIIRLYAGPGYGEAAAVMVLTLTCLVPASGTWLLWQVANATGRVRATSLYTLVTQPITLVLVFYVVSGLGWGASGVALALSLVTAVTGFAILWPLGLRLADVTFDAWVRRTLVPGLTPGCVAGVVWAALRLFIDPDHWAGIGLCVMAGAVCYGIVLLRFCLEPQDREDLAKMLAPARGLARNHLLHSGGSPRKGFRRPVPRTPLPEEST